MARPNAQSFSSRRREFSEPASTVSHEGTGLTSDDDQARAVDAEFEVISSAADEPSEILGAGGSGTDLVPLEHRSERTLSAEDVSAVLGDDLLDALDYASASKSAATLRAYKSDIRDFSAYSFGKGLSPFPASPEVIAAYISHLAKSGKKTRTIERRLAAIRFAHETRGAASPTTVKAVREVMAGIRRRVGRKADKKAPILLRHLEKILALVPETFSGSRDRALILLGFAGAFRRSELVALTMDDIIPSKRGLIVRIAKSKTDQAGEGQTVAIPSGNALCPVKAVNDWIAFSDITDGPLFRAVDRHDNLSRGGLNDRTVARIVKKYAAAAGLDPDKYAGHSLRSGVITEAAHGGKNLWKIRELSRHASLEMLREYVRDGMLFDEAATEGML